MHLRAHKSDMTTKYIVLHKRYFRIATKTNLIYWWSKLVIYSNTRDSTDWPFVLGKNRTLIFKERFPRTVLRNWPVSRSLLYTYWVSIIKVWRVLKSWSRVSKDPTLAPQVKYTDSQNPFLNREVFYFFGSPFDLPSKIKYLPF